MNHLSNHHATTNKPPITTTTTTSAATSTTSTATASWADHLSMVMDHHHHNHLIPLLDPVWHNYNPLPTPHPSPPLILKGSLSSHDHHQNHHDHHQDQNHEVVVEDQEDEEEEEELGAMKEMMYRIAVMQPVDIDPATIRKPKRRNVRISDDPQSVAARHRRERISEKIRILQRLVPGGTKMDTASMLDEAVRYVKFLKRQIRQLQNHHHHQSSSAVTTTANHHPPPPLPPPQLHLPPSDWVVGGSNSKVVLRDVVHEGMIFQHGGN